MDVEGAEFRVLRGAKHLLEGRHPGIILEINPDTLRKFGTSPLELYDSVREYGYGMQVIAREGGLVPVASYAVMVARRPAGLQPRQRRVEPDALHLG